MPKYEIGSTHGKLTILDKQSFKNGSGNWVQKVLVQCKCTNEYWVHHGNLKSVTQCKACRTKERKEVGAKYSRHPLYHIWQGMNQRCHNPHNDSYSRYGARGIYVCDRWRAHIGRGEQTNFLHFVDDMGDRPPGTSIDRIDNAGPYSPENCRWATIEEQANNTSTNVYIEHDGTVLSATQWTKQYGLPDNWVMKARKLGVSPEAALAMFMRRKRIYWKQLASPQLSAILRT